MTKPNCPHHRNYKRPECLHCSPHPQEDTLKDKFKKLWGADREGDFWNDPNCSAEEILVFLSQEIQSAKEEAFIEGYKDRDSEVKEAVRLAWDEGYQEGVKASEHDLAND